MDVTSYLLGKKSGGGSSINNQNKNVTITENGSTTLSADAGYTGLGTVGINVNVPAQGIDEYINTTSTLYGKGAFIRYIKKIPLIDTSGVSNMTSFFDGYTNLTSVAQINTSGVGNMSYMFNSCRALADVPLLDTSNVTNMSGMFYYCSNLTDTSIDNILQMCINAVKYSGTKTLSTLGFESSWASESRIQALPHYQSFINAGWTIGY